MSNLFLDDNAPRIGVGATRPGRYGLVIRLSYDVIDPGDSIEIEVFFSGYGEIVSSKAVFYPSPGIVDNDPEKSYAVYGMGTNEQGLSVWGSERVPLLSEGNSFFFCGGLQANNWPCPTIYFDDRKAPGPPDPPQVSTEVKLAGCAPLHVYLTTPRKVRPGSHSLHFLYTYFTGVTWESSSETVHFTIRNFYQRNEGRVWFLGAVAAFLGIVIAIWTIISWIVD